MDLIHARSERALAMANQLLRGALGRRMEVLIQGLLDVLARVEAHIDFPEEDLPAEDVAALKVAIEGLKDDLGRLMASGQYGGMLRDGIRTVLMGSTNVGKSSLLNRLVGRERALVSPEPGTTRDYLEEVITVGGHWLRFVDTAGLNPGAGGLEELGIRKSLEQVANADLVLWVVDPIGGVSPLPDQITSKLNERNTILIVNKKDIGDVQIPRIYCGFSTIRTSALTGEGLDGLLDAIERLALGFSTEVNEDLVAINSRHAVALGLAKEFLGAAREKLMAGEYAELVASDLRGALAAFGEIAGRVDNERMLDRLFASFCIGK